MKLEEIMKLAKKYHKMKIVVGDSIKQILFIKYKEEESLDLDKRQGKIVEITTLEKRI